MSDREEKLAEEISKIQKLAAENKDIDPNILIESLFRRTETTALPAKLKTRAYLVSLLAPPFGLYYVVKFFIQPEPGACRAAWTCLILTALAILLYLGFLRAVAL